MPESLSVNSARNDLIGGGLKRSQGEKQNHEYERFDERVLGSGDFVDSLKEDFQLLGRMKRVVALTQLLAIVSAVLALEPDLIRKPSKNRTKQKIDKMSPRDTPDSHQVRSRTCRQNAGTPGEHSLNCHD